MSGLCELMRKAADALEREEAVAAAGSGYGKSDVGGKGFGEGNAPYGCGSSNDGGKGKGGGKGEGQSKGSEDDISSGYWKDGSKRMSDFELFERCRLAMRRDKEVIEKQRLRIAELEADLEKLA